MTRPPGARADRPRGGWHASACSIQGPVRPRHDDVYAIRVAPPWASTGFAVFDGVGSDPRGGEAARAAASAFDAALEAGHPAERLLAFVNAAVQESGGATTGVMAVWPPEGPGTVVSAGDSSAYALDQAGKLRSLVPHDAVGAYQLTDFIGHAAIAGHVRRLAAGAAHGLLLCTDGVDGVLPPARIAAALAEVRRHPRTVPVVARRLLAEVEAAGAPDNATVLVAARLAGL